MTDTTRTPTSREMAHYLTVARQARSQAFADLFRSIRRLFTVRPISQELSPRTTESLG